MTESFLLQFIDNVFDNSLDYCVICFRTSKERRLEKPFHLKNFIRNVSRPGLSFKFNRSQQRVCYICERQAEAALRFLNALGVAINAHTAVEQLIESTVLRQQFHSGYITYIMNQREPNAREKSTIKHMLQLETELWKLNSKTQLLQTEVLIVDNDEFGKDLNAASNPGESSDMYVIPDLIPDSGSIVNILSQASSEIKVESILIDDDDEILTINAPLDTINTSTHYLKDSVNRVIIEAFQQEPFNYTPNEKPTLHEMRVDKNTKSKRKNKTDNQTRVDQIQQLITTDDPPTANFILYPIQLTSGVLSVPSLSANIMEGQLVTSSNQNLVFETPKLALQNGGNMEFLVDPYKVTNLLKNLSNQDISKVYIVKFLEPEGNTEISCDKESSICTISEARSLKHDDKNDENRGNFVSGAKVTKNGAKSNNGAKWNDQINWEDKIPMDVISFVNENESICKRPRSEQPPPLGISNVTSLNEEETIDLC